MGHYAQETLTNSLLKIGSIPNSNIDCIRTHIAQGTLFAFIDVIATPQSSEHSKKDNSDAEMQYLKKRLERLEGELFKLLPPEFEAPSSDSPFDN